MHSITKAARLNSFPDTSVWLEFSPLATYTKSINLGQGFPGWQPPGFVQEAIVKAVTDKRYFQYARSSGQPHLCEKIAELYSGLHKRNICPQKEILVTVGASEAIILALLAFINPGDEVILIEPYFDIYAYAIKMAGGIPKYIPLRMPKNISQASDLYLDIDELENIITPKTKAMILNSPHNPTGKVFTTAEYRQIAAVLESHSQIVVISDEVYENLIFPGSEHIPFATTPGMETRTISIYSAGKTFAVTGWKIGWVIAPPQLMKPLQTTQQWVVFAVANPLQEAVALCLEQAERPYKDFHNYYLDLQCLYNKKKNIMMTNLVAAGLTPIEPQGSFFILAKIDNQTFNLNEPPKNYETLTAKHGIAVDPKTANDKSYNFCRHLTVEKGITPIPPTAFYSEKHKYLGENYARFAFCKEDEELVYAGQKLQTLIDP